MLLVQEHLSLISSQYLARALQFNNPFFTVVTYPSDTRNMKQTLQYRFLHYVDPYLSSDILPSPPPTDSGINIKSLHRKSVFDSESFLSHNRVLQTALPEIELKEANFPRPYKLSFYNFVHPSVASSAPPVEWNPNHSPCCLLFHASVTPD